MKKLAGDTSPDTGYLTKRVGLINKYVCRLCGKEIPFADVKTELDKRTGYCKDCINSLKEKELILAGDKETIRKVAEREAAVQEILQAAKEGRVQEYFKECEASDDPEDEYDEDEDYSEEDEDDDF